MASKLEEGVWKVDNHTMRSAEDEFEGERVKTKVTFLVQKLAKVEK